MNNRTPISALRAALESPWPSLQAAARRLIHRALRHPTLQAAADELGVPRRSLDRLRTEFPEDFEVEEKSF